MSLRFANRENRQKCAPAHAADEASHGWVSPNTALVDGTRSRVQQRQRPVAERESRELQPTKEDRQALDEAYWVAVMMKGLEAEASFSSQLLTIPQRFQAPDVQLSRALPSSHIDSVEVVVFPTGCTEVKNRDHGVSKKSKRLKVRNVAEFLLHTKLHPVFAYPASTAILCVLERDQNTLPWQEVHRQLVASGAAHNEIYLITRTSLALEFELARVYPTYDHHIEFHLLDLDSVR